MSNQSRVMLNHWETCGICHLPVCVCDPKRTLPEQVVDEAFRAADRCCARNCAKPALSNRDVCEDHE